MKLNLFSKLIFATLLAFTVNSFVYFSFGNIYSSKILNYSAFQQQFSSGIYQYRILSGYFLLWIYEFLSTFNIDYSILKLKFFDAAAEPKMYLSFFLLNTFFMVLTAAVMVLITETKNFVATYSEKLLLITVAILTVALSQFVIVPYDISSYFFLLLFFLMLIRYLKKNSVQQLIILGIIMLISTVNRESSALSLSLAATLLYAKFGLKKETLFPLAVLGITFILTYFGMRMMSESFTTNDGNLFFKNFSQPKNILGLLFWALFFVFPFLVAKDRASMRNIIIFHLLSIPYIVMCFYAGILYEIRLYIPLFLCAMFLSRTDVKTFE
ncbi:hypothetical protein [Chryseobacterium sp. HSC-36S06]|uniref:hypothetical protein n=1 Tax=Chryseobacterium sp. HSC-36S06 TaxID=2910970 RepID=UPI0020A0B08A|nr:hypothetical protein [Chryseobacterium sp. HSC-36S06]MCP2037014.1 hypothetical protein [Chryseobacterium sp. HSC-36S06]